MPGGWQPPEPVSVQGRRNKPQEHDRDDFGSSSTNVNSAASTSCGGSRRPPPPWKHLQQGPRGGGGQPKSQVASTTGVAWVGRKRARDTTTIMDFTPPNKQATSSTRFSYALAVEGCKRVVLMTLDGSALTKEDPKLLGEDINKWTLDALAKKEFHNVPEILIGRQTKLGLEVKVTDARWVLQVRECAARVNLRVLTAEELEVLERPLRR